MKSNQSGTIVLHRRKSSSACGLRMTEPGNACPLPVILSVSEESLLFRADAHSRHPPPRGRETPAAIRFLSHCPSPANLRICRVIDFAVFYFRNSAFFACAKKAPKKHTKAGREKSPRLAIHPSACLKLSLSIIRRRAGRRSALLLLKCFVLET